jgi:small subunit ribosomal protein S16
VRRRAQPPLNQEQQKVAVKIRLLRMGKIRHPQYRIVVADSRTKRDGRAIEFVGLYHPKEDPSVIQVNSDRVQYWLGVGAQPSQPVQRLLEKTGDWQKFKGLPAPPPLLVAPEKVSRKDRYEAESRAAAGMAEAEKPVKKAEKKATKAAGESAPADPAGRAATGADSAPAAAVEVDTKAKAAAAAGETEEPSSADAAGQQQQG